MAGEMRASFKLRLNDQLSPGISRLMRLLDRLASVGRNLSLGGLSNGKNAVDATTGAAGRLMQRLFGVKSAADAASAAMARLDRLRERLNVARVGQPTGRGGRGREESGLGAVGAAASAVGAGALLNGLARPAATYEQVLRDIAMTGVEVEVGQGRNARQRPGAEVSADVSRSIEEMRGRFAALAVETGQRSQAIAAGAGRMIAAGLPTEVVDGLLPRIARVSTAANAAAADSAEVAIALTRQFGITAEEMDRTFAILIRSGQLGRFEYRDMAREFPGISAQSNAFGLRGQAGVAQMASALQVMERGATTPGQAPDFLRDLMAKLESDEVVKYGREHGVDIRGIMGAARRHNADPRNANSQLDLISVAAQTVMRATRGDASEINRMFGDIQAQSGARMITKFWADYLRFRDTALRADPAMVGRMFQDDLEGAHFQFALLDERLGQLGDRIGRAFLPYLPTVNLHFGLLLQLIERFDAEQPGMLDSLLTWGGVGLGVVATLSLLTLTFGFLGRGMRLVWTMLVLGGRVLSLLLAPLRLLSFLFGLVASPAAAAAAAVIAAALLIAGAVAIIVNHWEVFAPFFRALWEAVKAIFRGAVDVVMGLLTGDWDRVGRGAAAVWEGVKDALGATWEIIKGVFRIGGEYVAAWAGGAWAEAVAVVGRAWDMLVADLRAVWLQIRRVILQATTDAVADFRSAWEGIVGFFADLWQRARAPFDAFMAGIERRIEEFRGSWIGRQFGLSGPQVDAGRDAQGLPPDGERPSAPPAEWGAAGGYMPMRFDPRLLAPRGGGAASGPARTEVGGEVRLRLDPGLLVERVESDNPSVPVRVTTDRGQMVHSA